MCLPPALCLGDAGDGGGHGEEEGSEAERAVQREHGRLVARGLGAVALHHGEAHQPEHQLILIKSKIYIRGGRLQSDIVQSDIVL